MTTVAALLDRARQKTNRRDMLNRLNGALTEGATSIVYEFTANPPVVGGRVCVDLEDFHVWSNDTPTQTATVDPATNSTTAAIHADNAIVRISPEYSPFEILTAVNDELASLPGWGVVAHDEVTLTAGSVTGYDLDGVTGLLKVKKVSWFDTTCNNYRPVHRRLWKVDTDVPVDDFPSGYALSVFDPTVSSGASLQVTYTSGFTALSTLAQVVETVSGAPARTMNLLAVGAALRLTAGRATARANTKAQGDTRRADEVSTSDTRAAQSPLLLEYDRLLRAELRYQAKEHQ